VVAARTPPTKPRSRAKPILAIVALFMVGFALTQYLLNGDVARRLRAAFSNGAAVQPTDKIAAQPSEPSASIPESRPGETKNRLTIEPAPESAPAAAPEAPAVEASGPTPHWLKRLNYYRELAGEAPVREDQALSDGDRKHSKYLLENYIEL